MEQEFVQDTRGEFDESAISRGAQTNSLAGNRHHPAVVLHKNLSARGGRKEEGK